MEQPSPLPPKLGLHSVRKPDHLRDLSTNVSDADMLIFRRYLGNGIGVGPHRPPPASRAGDSVGSRGRCSRRRNEEECQGDNSCDPHQDGEDRQQPTGAHGVGSLDEHPEQ